MYYFQISLRYFLISCIMWDNTLISFLENKASIYTQAKIFKKVCTEYFYNLI